jgi:hypothetical protein
MSRPGRKRRSPENPGYVVGQVSWTCTGLLFLIYLPVLYIFRPSCAFLLPTAILQKSAILV